MELKPEMQHVDADMSTSGCVFEQYTDALGRGRIYHFLELALAHPGEDVQDIIAKEDSEVLFLTNYIGLFCDGGELCRNGVELAKSFFCECRSKQFDEIEAAYIAMFSANYPHIPCPPYGSLFIAVEGDKRLDEMREIKEFYQTHDLNLDSAFDDLPDHLCVELEFLQVLCFRESEAEKADDSALVTHLRAAQTEFLDRFLLPFAKRISYIANQVMPENLYSKLLGVTHCTLLQHRQLLAEQAGVESSFGE
jgi:TorA maturation chaperone TorD